MSSFVLAYSFGWKIQADGTLQQTSGIVFQTLADNVRIHVNDLLFVPADDRLVLTWLSPGIYEIKIEKPGYMPWKKTLQLKESQMIHFDEIYMFPNIIKTKNTPNKVKPKEVTNTFLHIQGHEIREKKSQKLLFRNAEKVSQIIPLNTHQLLLLTEQNDLFATDFDGGNRYLLAKNIQDIQIHDGGIYWQEKENFLWKQFIPD